MSATLDKDTFLKSYTLLIARTWSDDDFKDQVLKDPKTALSESGIEFRPDAKIVVVEHQVSNEEAAEAANGQKDNIDNQYNLWVAGNETGTYELRLPLRPEDFSLSDAALGAVAGGLAAASSDNYCCCCCPCCSCT